MNKEKIKLVYIDDDPEEPISAYLEERYRNEQYDIEFKEISFKCEEGYESLLERSDVTTANVILIDSVLFENDRVKDKGKFSGEEFRIILRKMFPFIEVLVITQNGENEEYGVIAKYRGGSSESAEQYYNSILKEKIDESIERVITFRNISKKLGDNKGMEKMLVENVLDSLNGISNYETLKKTDIDELIAAFQEIK